LCIIKSQPGAQPPDPQSPRSPRNCALLNLS